MMSFKSPARIDLLLVRCLSATITIIFSLQSDLLKRLICVWKKWITGQRWTDGEWERFEGKRLEWREIWDLTVGCQSRLWQQNFQLLLWRTPAARSPVLTIHRIQHARAAMTLISSWDFGKLTVTWMLTLWARKCFKGKRENKTCEVTVIFSEISWAVQLTVPSIMIGDTLAKNSGLMYSVTTVAMEMLCFYCFTHLVSWRLFVRWIKTKK